MALRTLEELNRNFMLENFSEQKTETQMTKLPAATKKQDKAAIISDVIFYLALLLIVCIIFNAGGPGGKPKMILGHSYFTVLTSSMEGEIPKGALILVKKTDPQDLNIGDNITFMRDANSSITHKVINIYDNYEDSGARGFQTKGVNNQNPDIDIVGAANVVGKVTLVIPGAGAVVSYLGANIHMVFILFGLSMLLSFSLRGLFVKPKWRKAVEAI